MASVANDLLVIEGSQRLVKFAFVANNEVEVAFVEVELPITVKFPLIVEEAEETNPPPW